jgi:hypothetical protein
VTWDVVDNVVKFLFTWFVLIIQAVGDVVVGFKISGQPLTLEISSPTIETDESPGELGFQ